MKSEDTVLEAEVVAIDDVTPDFRNSEPEAAPKSRAAHWGGKAMRIDPKWLPVFAVLGVILLIPVVAIAMCAFVIIGFFWILRGMWRALLRN